MIRFLGTILLIICLWGGTPSFASADCGDISVPEAFGTDSMPSGVMPITDCDNPFAVTDFEYPFRLFIDRQNILPGSTHYISKNGTFNYFAPHNYIYGDNLNSYYLHTDFGYELVAQTNDFTVDAQNRTISLLPGTYTLITDTLIYQDLNETSVNQTSWLPARVSMTFTLAPLDNEDDMLGASNILFLPGIQASRLYTRGMFGVRDQLWTPQNNNDVRQLAIDEVTGESVNAVHTQDIVDTVFGLGSIYKEIGEYFDSLYDVGKINSWASFAYDWRYAADDIVTEGVMYQDERRFLIDTLERLTWYSFSGKVTIVAHSNGGLLAKALITELDALGMAHLVDKVIFLASPQQGTPKAIGSILHGYDQSILGGLIVRADVARDTLRNFPSAYGLLPTQSYIQATGNQPLILFNEGVVGGDRERYGPTINTVSALDNFMTNTDGSRATPSSVYDIGSAHAQLLSNARHLQARLLEKWQAPSHIEVIEVAGIGLPTVSGFEYRPYFMRQCTTVLVLVNCAVVKINKPVPRLSLLGDETVMTASAVGYEGEKRSYFFDLGEVKDVFPRIRHHNFTEYQSIHNLLSNLIFDEQLPTPFITQVNTIGPRPYIMVGVHSPVTTTITSDTGRSLYVSTEGDFYEVVNQIEGAVAYYFGDTSYFILPADDTYTFVLQAYDEGVVTLEVDYIDVHNNQTQTNQVLIEAVTASTTIFATVEQSVIAEVFIDNDGDGSIDKVIDEKTKETIAPDTQDGDEAVQLVVRRGGGQKRGEVGTLMVEDGAGWLLEKQDTTQGAVLSEEERTYIAAVMVLLEELLRVLKLYERVIS